VQIYGWKKVEVAVGVDDHLENVFVAFVNLLNLVIIIAFMKE
jgi:hypothetical protein